MYKEEIEFLSMNNAVLNNQIKQLTAERDVAIEMLAAWCVAIDENGTGWDDWDEHYKDAAYRTSPIRDLLDKAMAAARSE